MTPSQILSLPVCEEEEEEEDSLAESLLPDTWDSASEIARSRSSRVEEARLRRRLGGFVPLPAEPEAGLFVEEASG